MLTILETGSQNMNVTTPKESFYLYKII